MYTKKPGKTQLPDRGPYTEYNPHTRDLSGRQWEADDHYKVISIDPGTKNFAIRVEVRPKAAGSDYQTYATGKIHSVLYRRLRLTDEVDEDCHRTVFDVLTEFFDTNQAVLRDSHFVVMERQLPINYRAVRISQHAFTYLMILLKNNTKLTRFIEVDPKLKGKELGAPPHLTEKGLKEWSVVKAKELFGQRDDQESLEALRRSKIKADDLADTATQVEAFFSYLKLPLTPPPVIVEIKEPDRRPIKIVDIPGLEFKFPTLKLDSSKQGHQKYASDLTTFLSS